MGRDGLPMERASCSIQWRPIEPERSERWAARELEANRVARDGLPAWMSLEARPMMAAGSSLKGVVTGLLAAVPAPHPGSFQAPAYSERRASRNVYYTSNRGPVRGALSRLPDERSVRLVRPLKPAVLKGLCATPRRRVDVPDSFDEFEIVAEFCCQGGRGVSLNR